MKSSIILKNWFDLMMDRFPEIGFNYIKKASTHYIAVYPYLEFSINEDYCKAENDIYDLLITEYPTEDFIFGSDEINFGILENAEKFERDFSKKQITSFEFKFEPEEELDFAMSENIINHVLDSILIKRNITVNSLVSPNQKTILI